MDTQTRNIQDSGALWRSLERFPLLAVARCGPDASFPARGTRATQTPLRNRRTMEPVDVAILEDPQPPHNAEPSPQTGLSNDLPGASTKPLDAQPTSART